MRYIFAVCLVCLLIVNCSLFPDEEKDFKTDPSFTTKYQGDIGIISSYKYIGFDDFSDEKAIRKYYVWENATENKIIMIYQLIANKEPFPKDLEWITPNALYRKNMRAAYTTVAGRPLSALHHFGMELPDCYILAQEIHIDESKKEAIFRILIVNDEFCTEDYEPVMEELDRVAIINPLG